MVVIELIAATVIAVGAVLTATGIVPQNRFFGVRTPATLRNDDGWRRGHRAALVPTVVSSAVTIVAAVVFVVSRRANEPLAVVLCTVPILVGAMWSVVAAQRAVR